MAISDLIRRKKAMDFAVQYRGKANKSGVLGPGVQKYETPTITERIQSFRKNIGQRKAEVIIKKKEADNKAKPESTISKGGTIIKTKGSFGKKVKERLMNRIQQNKSQGTGIFATNNNSGSIFSTNNSSGGFNPIYHGTSGKQKANNVFTMGSGNNPFTFSNEPKKEPIKPKRIKILYYK
jgi:hypothetical protein